MGQVFKPTGQVSSGPHAAADNKEGSPQVMRYVDNVMSDLYTEMGAHT